MVGGVFFFVMVFGSAVLNRVGILDKIVIIKHDRISNDCFFLIICNKVSHLACLARGEGERREKEGLGELPPFPSPRAKQAHFIVFFHYQVS